MSYIYEGMKNKNPTIKSASDNELINELKNRGYKIQNPHLMDQ